LLTQDQFLVFRLACSDNIAGDKERGGREHAYVHEQVVVTCWDHERRCDADSHYEQERNPRR
jgi:hypothetical protein